jgi:ATP-dependent Zn protease
LSCAAGYTLFVEDEAARANALLSRGDMEAVMVVHLAGRAAEKMVMGEAEVRLRNDERVLHVLLLTISGSMIHA